jgi:hypothetical protein
VSYPYPQDRHRDRKEKGEQPYKDARQAMTESEAALQTEAEAFGETRLDQTDEERMELLEAEASEAMQRVGVRRAEEHLAPADTADQQP